MNTQRNKPTLDRGVVNELLLNTDETGSHYIIPLNEAEAEYIKGTFKAKKDFPAIHLDRIDVVIKTNTIKVCGAVKWSQKLLQFCKPKKEIQGRTFYWDYVNEYYDFHNLQTGIEETGRFWEVILKKIGNPTHALIITK